MRISATSLWIAVSCTLVMSVDLAACGDKYIRLAGRLGPAYPAEHRATVLIFMPPESSVPAAAAKIGLKTTLETAGHRVHTIERDADLETTLSRRTYDVVIADGASAADVKRRLADARGRPTVVPIFHKETRREIEAARKRLGCLISSRERAYHAPAEIDHVMELRKAAAVAP